MTTIEARTKLDTTVTLLDLLLYKRGVSARDRDRFLYPSITDLHDPFLFTEIEKVVRRLTEAMEKGERIGICADYDHDGIPGAVVFTDALDALSYEHYDVYIPNRNREGFGFSTAAVDALKEKGCTLIITIDCGIGANESVAYAQKNGIDVIITDHHLPDNDPPDAFAIINPKYDEQYPFDGLCGTGVIFKVVMALLGRIPTESLDLVGIATLSDMVPLVDENRTLAHQGLVALRKTTRPGLQALYKKLKLSSDHLSEDDVIFMITPRINVASRIDEPINAYYLLKTKDVEDAQARAKHLEGLNKRRKGAVAAMIKETRKRLTRRANDMRVLVVGDRNWDAGLLGLIAQKLSEEYEKPVFVWGKGVGEVIKGSCRGAGVCDVVALMRAAPRDTFLEVGGHTGAGGFSITAGSCAVLEETLNKTLEKNSNVQLVDTAQRANGYELVAKLSIDDVVWETYAHIEVCGPFGMDNPKPVFAFSAVMPRDVAMFGGSGEHTKLVFAVGDDEVEAIAFFKKPNEFTKTPKAGELLTLHATIEKSVFRGFPEVRLRIVDIL